MDANLSGRCIADPVFAKIETPVDPECYLGPRGQVQKTQPFNLRPINIRVRKNINYSS
jgi:hypothetical protein